MQPQIGQLVGLHAGDSAQKPSQDSHVYAGLGTLGQQADHEAIAHLRVVNDQALLRGLNIFRELFARIDRADDKFRQGRIVRQALAIGVEEFHRFAHVIRFTGDHSEAAAAFHIGVSQVERHQVQFPAVDNHKLRVVAHEVVAGPRYRHSDTKEALFELSEVLLAGTVLGSDQGMHGDAPSYRVAKGAFDIFLIEAEDDDLHLAFRRSNRLDERLDSVSRLYE